MVTFGFLSSCNGCQKSTNGSRNQRFNIISEARRDLGILWINIRPSLRKSCLTLQKVPCGCYNLATTTQHRRGRVLFATFVGAAAAFYWSLSYIRACKLPGKPLQSCNFSQLFIWFVTSCEINDYYNVWTPRNTDYVKTCVCVTLSRMK